MVKVLQIPLCMYENITSLQNQGTKSKFREKQSGLLHRKGTKAEDEYFSQSTRQK